MQKGEKGIGSPASDAIKQLVGQRWLHSRDTPLAAQDVFMLLRNFEPSLCVQAPPEIVRPQSKSEAPPLSLSVRTGYCRQPLHTDQAHFARPARFILLECVEEGNKPCATDILVPDIKRLELEAPNVLIHPGWIARRGPNRRFYCQILTRHKDGTLGFRFDPGCMTNQFVDQSLALAKRVLESGAAKHSVVLNTGDWLVVDNWLALHGRSNGAYFAKSRRLRRTYWGIE